MKWSHYSDFIDMFDSYVVQFSFALHLSVFIQNLSLQGT